MAHVAFRPIGLDYFLARRYDPVNANGYIQNDLRYFAGVNLLVGGQLAGRAGREGVPCDGGHPAKSCPC
jgi:hypothetical protein